ncbi:hypothetical protein AAVH_39591 [Aphelenchoides avenae]|nr:hypothetical protein AAVH_39591 [Aphelenchus avenae]
MPGAARSSRFTRASAKAQSSTPQTSTDTEASSAIKEIPALSKLTEVDDNANKRTEQYKQELHEKRLKELRKRLREAQKDDWRYPRVGSLFGFSKRH